jgi:hypothetical protein
MGWNGTAAFGASQREAGHMSVSLTDYRLSVPIDAGNSIPHAVLVIDPNELRGAFLALADKVPEPFALTETLPGLGSRGRFGLDWKQTDKEFVG